MKSIVLHMGIGGTRKEATIAPNPPLSDTCDVAMQSNNACVPFVSGVASVTDGRRRRWGSLLSSAFQVLTNSIFGVAKPKPQQLGILSRLTPTEFPRLYC
jgi:hypothetical protein